MANRLGLRLIGHLVLRTEQSHSKAGSLFNIEQNVSSDCLHQPHPVSLPSD